MIKQICHEYVVNLLQSKVK